MTSRVKQSLVLVAGLSVLTAALLYSMVTNSDWRHFDFRLFLQSFRGLQWAWVGAAFLLIYSTYLTRALRWRILIRPVKQAPRLWNLVSATVIGFGAIAVMGRPGEFVRPYLVAKKENLPVSGQLAVWVLERSFDTLILLAGIAFAVGSYQPVSEAGPLPAQWWNSLGRLVGLASIGVLAMLVLLRGYYDAMRSRAVSLLRGIVWSPLRTRLGEIEHFLAVFGQGLASLRDWRAMGMCLLWGLLQWFLVALSYYAVLLACAPGLRLNLEQAIIFMGIAMAGSAFQIPGVGGGMQIASVLALTEIFQMQVELATSTAILVWALTFLAILPPALILLVQEGLTWAKLRELESEV